MTVKPALPSRVSEGLGFARKSLGIPSETLSPIMDPSVVTGETLENGGS